MLVVCALEVREFGCFFNASAYQYDIIFYVYLISAQCYFGCDQLQKKIPKIYLKRLNK